jgi:stage IV sporulation protein B
MSKAGKRRVQYFAAALLFAAAHSSYFQSIDALPKSITLTQDTAIAMQLPFGIRIGGDPLPVSVSASEDETLGTRMQAQAATGSAQTSFSLFGILPIKSVEVSVVQERTLQAGGQLLGIALLTDGALVVGTSKVLDEAGTWRDPAVEAGLLPGDLITHINGQKVENAAFMSESLTDLNADVVDLAIVREDQTLHVYAQPVLEAGSGMYRLGIWVRDSTAGVGTLTYADVENGVYGALGHGIVDGDTHQYLTVQQGCVVAAKITGITPGQVGAPGQISGSYSIDQTSVGNILRNNAFGIFGQLQDVQQLSEQTVLPIALRSQVERGPAQILCQVDGTLEAYDCMIEKITPQRSAQAKSMVIRVTDEQLLRNTGGIVQGMSGSPLIQNGKLIGAVTHVFVNDPTRGYGVFIEWMLEQSDAIAQAGA